MLCLVLLTDRIMVEKKEVPHCDAISLAYGVAYEQGWAALQPEDKANIIWFTCKVMPAVQKNWKPYQVGQVKNYFDVVTASDEAFGLFILKYYKDLPQSIKNGEGRRQNQERSARTRKEKLSGKKLKTAIKDYDLWFKQFKLLRTTINPATSTFSQDIEEHAKQERQALLKDRPKRDKYSINSNSLELAIVSLPV